jgi:outer membrane protein OmpA-like peptidoglycan-associated protein
MTEAGSRSTVLMTGCLILGLADIMVLNLVLFPRVRAQLQASPPPADAVEVPQAPRLAPPVAEVEGVDPAPPAPTPRAAVPEPALAEIAALPEPAPAPPSPPPPPREKVLARLELDRPQVILFETGESRLDREAQATIDRLAARLAAVPATTLVIEGHADVRGPETANDQLSEDRARAVMRRLAAEGISRRRLIVRGFGSRRPVVGGTNPDSLRRNRRVEVSVRRGTS